MGGRSRDDPGNGAVVALAGGSWQCSGIAGFPKVVESIPGAGGKGRVALPFLQLHGEGEVCDSPHSYLIHYDEAGV